MTTIWSGGWILIPIKISDETPPGFHPRWNMSFILEQTLAFKWDLLLIKTTHGNNAVPEKTGQCIISYCFIGEDMSKSWDSCFIRFQTLVDEARSPSFWHDVKHSLLLRLFLNFELLHFESWNSWFIDFFLLVPRHRLRTKETIQPNNKPFTLSCWCYLRVYLVPRKTEKSFPLMLVCWDATRKKQTGRFVTRSAQIINFWQGYRNP